MVTPGRIAASHAGIVVLHDHAINHYSVRRNFLRLLGSLREIALFGLGLQRTVVEPNVDLLRMHISAKPIRLAHDKVYQHHIGEILYLNDLLNRSLDKSTAVVFAV